MSDQQYKHIIYVSYADADEDWVISLVNGLKVYLRKQLGELDDNFIWAKYMCGRYENRLTVPPQHLQQSKCLLTVLSPAYLKTIGDNEINLFNNADNIFVVECDKICRPKNLPSVTGYQFWSEDKVGNVIRCGDPEPLPNEREYYRLLDQMARDIVKVLDKPKKVISNTPEQLSIDNYKFQPISKVFINTTEEDRTVALDVQKHLNGNIASFLPPSLEVGFSLKEMKKDLEENLLNCDTTIIICDQAPLKWVHQQVKLILKLSVKRKKKTTSGFKVLILNKPPPNEIKRHCSFEYPNIKMWDCADIIANCIQDVKEVILS